MNRCCPGTHSVNVFNSLYEKRSLKKFSQLYTDIGIIKSLYTDVAFCWQVSVCPRVCRHPGGGPYRIPGPPQTTPCLHHWTLRPTAQQETDRSHRRQSQAIHRTGTGSMRGHAPTTANSVMEGIRLLHLYVMLYLNMVLFCEECLY